MQVNASLSMDSLRRVTCWCGAAAALLGLLGVMSWLAGVRELAGIRMDWIPMAPSTGGCFLVMGVLLARQDRGGQSALVQGLEVTLVALIACFGLLNLLEYYVGVSLTFDEALVHSTEKLGGVSIYIMSPLTGAAFFLVGIAQIFILMARDSRGLQHLVGILGTMVSVLAFTCIISYLFDTPLLYGSGMIPVAATTAAAFQLLGVGLIFAAGPESFPLQELVGPSVRARLLRAFLPLLAVTIVVQAWLYINLNRFPSINVAVMTAVLALILILISSEVAVLSGRVISRNIERLEAQRQQAEEALQESRDRLLEEKAFTDDLFNSTSDTIFVFEPATGKAIRWNEIFSRVSRYTDEEIASLKVPDSYYSQDDLQRAGEAMKEIFTEGRGAIELTLLTKDGGAVPFEYRASLVCDKVGAPRWVIAIGRDITERKLAEAEILQQREELRGLAIRLAEAEEVERRQLAKELHDEVCQNLANIGIALDVLKLKSSQEPMDRWLSQLDDVSKLVEETGEITRSIMEGLRSTVLDHYGFEGGLRQFASKFTQKTGIAVDFLGHGVSGRLPASVELALFRISQEALANVAKHSKATQIQVLFEEQENLFRLTIADNGEGFNLDQTGRPLDGKRWGLMIMGERAMAIGGICRVESQPGHGTHVVVEVPC